MLLRITCNKYCEASEFTQECLRKIYFRRFPTPLTLLMAAAREPLPEKNDAETPATPVRGGVSPAAQSPAAQPTSAQPTSAQPTSPQGDKIVRFKDLSQCGDEIWIEHEGKLYRLQKTRQGKLILTK